MIRRVIQSSFIIGKHTLPGTAYSPPSQNVQARFEPAFAQISGLYRKTMNSNGKGSVL